MTLLKTLVLAVAVLGAGCDSKPAEPAPAPAPETAATGPALWKASDADTTIYLFGTVHVLPPALEWRKPAIEKALDEAKAVYFETDVNPNPASLGTTVQKLGLYPPGQMLSDSLTAEQKTKLAAASARLSVPMPMLETMRPWLAAVTLGEQMITNAGYDPASGVERKIEPMAREAGKEIRKLETIEEQLLAFADLSESVQVGYLMDGVEEMDAETTMLNDLVQAWAKGDLATLEKIMIEGDLAEMPEIYEALLVKRNRNWAVQLEKLAKDEAGVFFIAVGAGHLIGKESVIVLLEGRGLKPERIE